MKSNKVLTIIPFLSVIMISLFSCTTTRWLYIEPESAPSPRSYTAMVYDSESDRIIMVSGQESLTGGPFPRDTWAFDMNTMSWNNKNPNNTPRGRSGHAMAYDSESDRTVLFSGWMATNDTWAYDLNTNTWTEKTPVKSPQTRFGHRMVYDAESDKVILFGGWMNFEDTWSYDFNTNTWENMNPSVHPSARAYHTMTYDAESDRVILFGGGEPGSMPSYKKIFNETWAYDYNSNTWANMNPENQPSSRVYAGMVYADESDRIILFGGGTHSQGQEDIDFTGSYETWIYDFNSNVWTKLKTKKHPSPRKKHVMCYDMESDNILLFSGQVFTDRGFKSLNNETWTFKY